jgi:hypothetical protein
MPTKTSVACPRCQASYPDVAHYCAKCGADVRGADISRRGAFAADPSEPLFSMNFVSSLMPLAGRGARQTFKWALLIGLGIAAVAAAVGFLPFALAVAAVTVPIVYVLYLYDVNEWEDQPVPVVVGAIALAGALGLGFTLLWRDVFLDGVLVSFRPDGTGFDVESKVLLITGLVVPLGLLVLAQLGPLWLVAKRNFDDLIDGLTFGIAAGAAFATLETIVMNSGVLFDGPSRIESPDAAIWVSIIVIGGLLRPVVYGSAVGLAVASFSGKGEGIDGFGPGYVRGSIEAFVSLVAFEVGLYLTGRLGGSLGVVLGLAWALIVAAVLVLRIRLLLHTALLEGALEAQARGEAPATASRAIGFCGECEMPLLHEASFCSACGASVRAASKMTRAANADAAGSKAKPANVVWGTDAVPSEGANRKSAATMVGVAVAVAVIIGGAFVAVNAATRDDTDPDRIHFDDKAQGSNLHGSRAAHPAGLTDTTTDDVVELENGQQVAVPTGWEIQKQGDNFVILENADGAFFRVTSGSTGGDPVSAAEIIQKRVDLNISQEVEEIEGTLGEVDPEQYKIDGIVSAASLPYEGIITTTQGSTTVEGYVEALVLDSDQFTIMDSVNRTGDFETFKDDYNAIYHSLLESLPLG